MDLITQGLLGACVGQRVGQKKLGRRSIVMGALAGMLPDADMIVGLSKDPLNVLIHHRGISHSLWFGPVVGSLLALLTFWYYRKRYTEDTYGIWAGVFIASLVTHPLLDWFTTYGTQLLAPFSNHRFSLNAIGIIDPFYSLPLLFPCILGLLNYKRFASFLSTVILTLTTGYLLWGIQQNDMAIRLAQQQLQQEQVSYQQVNAYPTMLQLFLRRIVVHTQDEVKIGFISTWAPQTIHWSSAKKANAEHTQILLNQTTPKIFAWFSEQQYMVIEEKTGQDCYLLTMTDLRLGYSDRTLWGIWNVSAVLNAQNNTVQDIRYNTYVFDHNSVHLLKDLFLEAFGYKNVIDFTPSSTYK